MAGACQGHAALEQEFFRVRCDQRQGRTLKDWEGPKGLVGLEVAGSKQEAVILQAFPHSDGSVALYCTLCQCCKWSRT